MVRLLRQVPFGKDEERIAGLEVQIAAPPWHILHKDPRGFPLLAAEQREARLLQIVRGVEHFEQHLIEEIPHKQEAEPDREQIVRSGGLLGGVEIPFHCD